MQTDRVKMPTIGHKALSATLIVMLILVSDPDAAFAAEEPEFDPDEEAKIARVAVDYVKLFRYLGGSPFEIAIGGDNLTAGVFYGVSGLLFQLVGLCWAIVGGLFFLFSQFADVGVSTFPGIANRFATFIGQTLSGSLLGAAMFAGGVMWLYRASKGAGAPNYQRIVASFACAALIVVIGVQSTRSGETFIEQTANGIQPSTVGMRPMSAGWIAETAFTIQDGLVIAAGPIFQETVNPILDGEGGCHEYETKVLGDLMVDQLNGEESNVIHLNVRSTVGQFTLLDVAYVTGFYDLASIAAMGTSDSAKNARCLAWERDRGTHYLEMEKMWRDAGLLPSLGTSGGETLVNGLFYWDQNRSYYRVLNFVASCRWDDGSGSWSVAWDWRAAHLQEDGSGRPILPSDCQAASDSGNVRTCVTGDSRADRSFGERVGDETVGAVVSAGASAADVITETASSLGARVTGWFTSSGDATGDEPQGEDPLEGGLCGTDIRADGLWDFTTLEDAQRELALAPNALDFQLSIWGHRGGESVAMGLLSMIIGIYVTGFMLIAKLAATISKISMVFSIPMVFGPLMMVVAGNAQGVQRLQSWAKSMVNLIIAGAMLQFAPVIWGYVMVLAIRTARSLTDATIGASGSNNAISGAVVGAGSGILLIITTLIFIVLYSFGLLWALRKMRKAGGAMAVLGTTLSPIRGTIASTQAGAGALVAAAGGAAAAGVGGGLLGRNGVVRRLANQQVNAYQYSKAGDLRKKATGVKDRYLNRRNARAEGNEPNPEDVKPSKYSELKKGRKKSKAAKTNHRTKRGAAKGEKFASEDAEDEKARRVLDKQLAAERRGLESAKTDREEYEALEDDLADPRKAQESAGEIAKRYRDSSFSESYEAKRLVEEGAVVGEAKWNEVEESWLKQQETEWEQLSPKDKEFAAAKYVADLSERKDAEIRSRTQDVNKAASGLNNLTKAKPREVNGKSKLILDADSAKADYLKKNRSAGAARDKAESFNKFAALQQRFESGDKLNQADQKQLSELREKHRTDTREKVTGAAELATRAEVQALQKFEEAKEVAEGGWTVMVPKPPDTLASTTFEPMEFSPVIAEPEFQVPPGAHEIPEAELYEPEALLRDDESAHVEFDPIAMFIPDLDEEPDDYDPAMFDDLSSPEILGALNEPPRPATEPPVQDRIEPEEPSQKPEIPRVERAEEGSSKANGSGPPRQNGSSGGRQAKKPERPSQKPEIPRVKKPESPRIPRDDGPAEGNE